MRAAAVLRLAEPVLSGPWAAIGMTAAWVHGGGEAPEPGRNGARNFRGERRSNETHASTTDPDACAAATALVDRRFGRLRALVNNAGIGGPSTPRGRRRPGRCG